MEQISKDKWCESPEFGFGGLIEGALAAELVESIAHLENLPEWIGDVVHWGDCLSVKVKQSAQLVLLMYTEMAAGRLLMRPAGRVALLANWHVVLKSILIPED